MVYKSTFYLVRVVRVQYLVRVGGVFHFYVFDLKCNHNSRLKRQNKLVDRGM